MEEQVRKHFIEKYGSICDELEHCLKLHRFGKGETLEQAIDDVEWTFECEWDASLDYWYKKFVGAKS